MKYWTFNPTVVRLRHERAKLLLRRAAQTFNPTVVRLRLFDFLATVIITQHFQSHCGAIATNLNLTP